MFLLVAINSFVTLLILLEMSCCLQFIHGNFFLFQFCLILTVIQLVFSKAYQSLKCFICFGFLNDGALSTVSVVFKRLTLL